MTPIKRSLIAVPAVVILGLSLTACGGDAPTDASKEDFCASVGALESADAAGATEAIKNKDYDKLADVFSEYADKVEETGTPEDITDDERAGFEILLEKTKDLDAGKIEEALDEEKDPLEGDLSDEDKKKVDAYNAYEERTCSGS